MLMAFAARALPFSLAIAVWTGSAAAQTSELKNPVEGQPKAIERGEYVYKKRCSTCHGFDARGYRAPDLTAGPYSRGTSDAQLFRVIMRGIPRTEMPANALDEDDAWALIAYIRTVIVPNAKPDVRGNADAGEKIFWGKANCSSCHMVNGKGGRLGPDLSIVGRARSAMALEREIRKTAEYIPPGYEPVTVVTRDGGRIKGSRKNEDSYSIQMMDTNERLLTFFKTEVREVIDEKGSLMPDYGPDKLTSTELDDILAYLRTLRGR
jgi:putative heme-binding domain-containing protein